MELTLVGVFLITASLSFSSVHVLTSDSEFLMLEFCQVLFISLLCVLAAACTTFEIPLKTPCKSLFQDIAGWKQNTTRAVTILSEMYLKTIMRANCWTQSLKNLRYRPCRKVYYGNYVCLHFLLIKLDNNVLCNTTFLIDYNDVFLFKKKIDNCIIFPQGHDPWAVCLLLGSKWNTSKLVVFTVEAYVMFMGLFTLGTTGIYSVTGYNCIKQFMCKAICVTYFIRLKAV